MVWPHTPGRVTADHTNYTNKVVEVRDANQSALRRAETGFSGQDKEFGWHGGTEAHLRRLAGTCGTLAAPASGSHTMGSDQSKHFPLVLDDPGLYAEAIKQMSP